MQKDKSKMTVVQITLLTAINMMGSGIMMLPAKLAEVGTISIISWLVTAGGATALAYVFAKCGMFSKKSGGMGGYAEYAFGKTGNFLANYTYGISLLIANVAIAITVVGYSAEFFSVTLSPVMVALLTMAVLWITSLLNAGGARLTGRLSSFAIFGSAAPVIGMCLIGWFWFDPSLYIFAWNPYHYPFSDAVSMSISMTLWTFLGLESACANMDSVENPEKNIPIAVLTSTLGTALIYILSTSMIAGIVPNEELAASTAPFGLAFSVMLGGTAGKIVIALMVMACFGSLLGWQFTIARVFCSSAREGYFPRLFKKVTADDVPLAGLLVITGFQTVLAMMTISPTLTAQFNILVDLAVVTNIVPYLLSMASIGAILRSSGVSVRQIRFTSWIAAAAILYNIYALYTTGPEALAWGGVLTLAGWILYGLLRKRLSLASIRD